MPSHLLQFSADKKPVVVWNVTRRCNLRCVHCYSRSEDLAYGGELTPAEGRALLEDLAAFGVPVVLFSGGEPLTRPDLFELIERAVALKMRAVLSTNGTLITPEAAARLKRSNSSYVGVSLDGLGAGERPVPRRGRRVRPGYRGHPQLQGGRHQGGPALHDHAAQRRGDRRPVRPGAERGHPLASASITCVYAGAAAS